MVAICFGVEHKIKSMTTDLNNFEQNPSYSKEGFYCISNTLNIK